MSSKAAKTLDKKEAKVWIEYRPHLHPCAIDAFQNCDVENSELCVPDMFLCGQYELDENSEGGASRGGSIHVCTINSESNSLSVTTTDCKSGVLDLKVAGDYVASAQSDSSLCIHQILKENEGGGASSFAEFSPLHLKEIVTITEEDEGLFLSVDWDLGYTIDKTNVTVPGDCRLVRRCSASEIGLINPNIAVSTQEGSLIVYELSNERQLSKTFKVSMAHQMFGQAMPAWIVCFDPHTKKTLVSGGDDCLMKLWDLRQGSVPTHTNKGHSAGVTSAQWHPQQENIFATGSYDEYLRIWDNRALRSPVTEIHAGGGVWRTKWNLLQEKSSFLFLSCMQGGSAIVEYNHGEASCLVRVKHMDKNNLNHLAYGIDVLGVRSGSDNQNRRANKSEIENGNDNENRNKNSCQNEKRSTSIADDSEEINDLNQFVTIASCSFYDNLIQIWDTGL